VNICIFPAVAFIDRLRQIVPGAMVSQMLSFATVHHHKAINHSIYVVMSIVVGAS
jgi:hypothetical protein